MIAVHILTLADDMAIPFQKVDMVPEGTLLSVLDILHLDLYILGTVGRTAHTEPAAVAASWN